MISAESECVSFTRPLGRAFFRTPEPLSLRHRAAYLERAYIHWSSIRMLVSEAGGLVQCVCDCQRRTTLLCGPVHAR